MKYIKKIIITVIVLAFAFVYAHIAKANDVYDRNIDNSQYQSTGLVQNGTIEQSFVSVEDTLDGVSVKTQTIGDVTDVVVKYTLEEVDSGKIVAEGNVDAKDIKNGKFQKYSFDTVEKCKGKSYRIIFEISNTTENNGVGFYFEPQVEKSTIFTVAGNNTQGTLILKTITNRFDFETFAVLLIFVVYIVLFMKFLYKLFK